MDIKIIDKTYSFKDLTYDDFIYYLKDDKKISTEFNVNFLNDLLLSDKKEFEELIEEYPTIVSKIISSLFSGKSEEMTSDFKAIVDNKEDSIFRFALGFYSVCKYGPTLNDTNQRYLYYVTSKFIHKIDAFIDSYVKSNSKAPKR